MQFLMNRRSPRVFSLPASVVGQLPAIIIAASLLTLSGNVGWLPGQQEDQGCNCQRDVRAHGHLPLLSSTDAALHAARFELLPCRVSPHADCPKRDALRANAPHALGAGAASAVLSLRVVQLPFWVSSARL